MKCVQSEIFEPARSQCNVVLKRRVKLLRFQANIGTLRSSYVVAIPCVVCVTCLWCSCSLVRGLNCFGNILHHLIAQRLWQFVLKSWQEIWRSSRDRANG